MYAASNRNFDRLWAQQNLRDAQQSLKTWEKALRDVDQSDLGAVDFLKRSVDHAKVWIENAKWEWRNY